MMLEKLEELVLLKLGDLNIGHRLGVIFKEFLQSGEIAVAKVVFYLVKKVLERQLGKEVVLFWVQMILCIILL